MVLRMSSRGRVSMNAATAIPVLWPLRSESTPSTDTVRVRCRKAGCAGPVRQSSSAARDSMQRRAVLPTGVPNTALCTADDGALPKNSAGVLS